MRCLVVLFLLRLYTLLSLLLVSSFSFMLHLFLVSVPLFCSFPPLLPSFVVSPSCSSSAFIHFFSNWCPHSLLLCLCSCFLFPCSSPPPPCCTSSFPFSLVPVLLLLALLFLLLFVLLSAHNSRLQRTRRRLLRQPKP